MEGSGPQLCPDNVSAYAGATETLRCVCTGEAVLRSSNVWGTNAYMADSGTCGAARHAGVVPVTGGIVELKMQPGDAAAPRGPYDNQGGPNVNVPLSQRRAASVQAWLLQNGVSAAPLSADGRGQNEPIADNTSEAGRSLNRRVEAVRID